MYLYYQLLIISWVDDSKKKFKKNKKRETNLFIVFVSQNI
jgi:hypothetical protein